MTYIANHITKEDFYNKRFLYHYTNAESLISILHTMSIKTSSFENLNDLNEASIYNFYLGGYKEIFVDRIIKDRCRVFSFTRDSDEPRGFNHPGMWAYYADNNKGACLVFDEKAFRDINANLFQSDKDVWLENVEYNGKFEVDDETIETMDNEQFIRHNYRKLFMTKHPDWAHECEKRLVGLDLPEFIPIGDALKGVILGNKFMESGLIDKLCTEISNRHSCSYKKITPFSFWECSNMLYDYEPYQSSMIVTRIINTIESIGSYSEWLKKEYGR